MHNAEKKENGRKIKPQARIFVYTRIAFQKEDQHIMITILSEY